MMRDRPLADFSPEWAEHSINYLIENNLLTKGLPQDHLRFLAVSLLICDDNGSFMKDDLEEALLDPSIVNAADQLIRKASEHGMVQD